MLRGRPLRSARPEHRCQREVWKRALAASGSSSIPAATVVTSHPDKDGAARDIQGAGVASCLLRDLARLDIQGIGWALVPGKRRHQRSLRPPRSSPRPRATPGAAPSSCRTFACSLNASVSVTRPVLSRPLAYAPAPRAPRPVQPPNPATCQPWPVRGRASPPPARTRLPRGPG